MKSCDADGAEPPPDFWRVGLALSGGGIRSASFNLGLLQALDQHDVLDHVDYLSTVSGGGYIGSYLSSLTVAEKTSTAPAEALRDPLASQTAATLEDGASLASGTASMAANADDGDGRAAARERQRLPITPLEGDDRQPPHVVRLTLGGTYLARVYSLIHQALGGAIVNTAAIVLALLTATGLAAVLFRYLDDPDRAVHLSALGFRSDVTRAFVPTVCLGVIWVLAVKLDRFLARFGLFRIVQSWLARHVRPLFGILFLASIALALTALLSTGDIGLSWFPLDPAKNAEYQELVHSLQGTSRWVLGIVVIVALLPYLRPSELIRSGTRPRNAVESWVFKIASYGLIVGVPFLCFGLLSRENISFSVQKRDNPHLLSRGYVTDWPHFLQFVLATAKAEEERHRQLENEPDAKQSPKPTIAGPNSLLLSHVEQGFPEPWKTSDKNKTCEDRATELLRVKKALADYDEEAWPWQRWWDYCFANEEEAPLTREKKSRQLSNQICLHFNEALIAEPKFYAAFADWNPDYKLRPTWVTHSESDYRRILSLRDQARGLASSGKIEPVRAFLPSSAGSVTESPFRLAAARDQTWRKSVERQALEEINGQLARAYYEPFLRPESTIFASDVWADDQAMRWKLLAGFAGGFVFLIVVVNLNTSSVHGFYRDRLSQMWLRPDDTTQQDRAGESIRLADLRRSNRHLPYHLINATLNDFSSQGIRENPPRDSLTRFVFSRHYCGSSMTRYYATEEFAGGKFTLNDAMAISGAAVTPTLPNNPFLRWLLFALNSRTGQWIPNPRTQRRPGLPYPSLGGWLCDRIRQELSKFRSQPNAERAEPSWFFISDGGHLENTGIDALLERRCRLIIASDASCDPNSDFLDLIKLMRRASAIHGIRFERQQPTSRQAERKQGPLADVVPNGIKKRLAERHYVVFKITYPAAGPTTRESSSPEDDRTGYLLYLKPTFDGDEPPELRYYRNDNGVFPHDPTLDQLYDPRKFECYRRLGHHIAESIFGDWREKYHLDEQVDLREYPQAAGNPLTCLFAERSPPLSSAADAVSESFSESPLQLVGAEPSSNGATESTANVAPNKPRPR